MHCGSALFDNMVIKPLLERFIPGKQETNKFCYIGFGIDQNHEEITLDQGKYVTELQGIRIDPGRAKEKSSLLTPEEQKQLRSLVGQCNWVAQGTRLDLTYEVVELCSKFNKAVVSDLIRANKNLLKLKQLKSFIRFQNLGPSKDWKIVVFSDASHANIDSVSSVGGHIVLIARCKKRSAPIA